MVGILSVCICVLPVRQILIEQITVEGILMHIFLWGGPLSVLSITQINDLLTYQNFPHKKIKYHCEKKLKS